MKKSIFGLVALILFAAGCKTKSGEDRDSYLPPSRSSESEVILVMDSSKWNSDLGDAITKTFARRIPGLPQPEPFFSLKQVRPSSFRSIFKQATNIIIVMTLDNTSREGAILKSYFTDESLERIRNNKDLFMFTGQNVFAQNQNVLYLFGQNDRQLIEHLEKNEDQLIQYFLKKEMNRISDKVYSGKPKENLSKKLLSDHQFSLRIPPLYELAKEEESFIWLRQLGEIDKSILVYYQPYETEAVFESEGLRELRDKIGRQYLADVEDTSIYMTTETIIPIDLQQINMNGKYAVEARGLWKLSDGTLGGPFIAYIFVDEKLNRLYYVEGYVASPGQKKRETIRELEVVLKTFRTASESQQKS